MEQSFYNEHVQVDDVAIIATSGSAPCLVDADCDDDNPCTDDYCDPTVGCSFTNHSRTCDDGDPCTGGDVCQIGVCAGTTYVCTGPVELLNDSFDAGLSNWSEVVPGWDVQGLHASSGYPASGSGGPAASSGDCATTCIIELNAPIDLTGFSAAQLELSRFLDSTLDNGEFLHVALWNGSAWTTPAELNWAGGFHDDNTWHQESFDLAAFLGVDDFRIALYASRSQSWEHIQVDDLRVIAQP